MSRKVSIMTTIGALFVVAIAPQVQAASYVVQTFDTDPALSPTQAPDTWYTDRYAPAEFKSISDPTGEAALTGGKVLLHGIRVADGADNRPGGYASSFYNTQGRKYDTIANSVGTYWSADLYVPTDWQTSDRRMAGLWATTMDPNDQISGYPIVEFASDSSNPRFQFYTQDVNQDPNDGFQPGFVDLGLPTDFDYGEWYRLTVLLTATDYQATVQAVTGSSTDIVSYSDQITFGSVRAANIILQGHNTQTGVSYDIYWDNVTTAIPLPMALPAGLAALGALSIRRRRN